MAGVKNDHLTIGHAYPLRDKPPAKTISDILPEISIVAIALPTIRRKITPCKRQPRAANSKENKMSTTRINTADSHGKWAVVTASSAAEYCITCFDSKKEAIDRMNEEGDAGNNAEVMLTTKALKMYQDCIIQ
jgi:hypothetical protein